MVRRNFTSIKFTYKFCQKFCHIHRTWHNFYITFSFFLWCIKPEQKTPRDCARPGKTAQGRGPCAWPWLLGTTPSGPCLSTQSPEGGAPSPSWGKTIYKLTGWLASPDLRNPHKSRILSQVIAPRDSKSAVNTSEHAKRRSWVSGQRLVQQFGGL